MSKFYLGQRVRIVGCVPGFDNERWIGFETEITSPGGPHAWLSSWPGVWYFVSLDDGGWCFREEDLEPLRDDDTNTVTSWEQCIWKPAGVRA